MFTKQSIIAFVVAVLLVSGLTIFLYDRWVKATDVKRRAEFDAERAVSKQITDTLRQERDEQKRRADEAEQRALVATEKVAGLQAEFAKFGAAGAAAIKRQEEAAKQYELDKTSIRNTVDACALCQSMCAERERQSTADNDLRCSPTLCQQYCAGP